MNCKNCGYGLKQRCGDFEKIICTYEEGECVKIAELEQENAELKAVERMALYSKMSDRLAKAKEILREYIRINLLPPIERNFDDEVKLFKEAEQFIKDSEVEK